MLAHHQPFLAYQVVVMRKPYCKFHGLLHEMRPFFHNIRIVNVMSFSEVSKRKKLMLTDQVIRKDF